jgi:hypothetical protein
MRRTLLALVLPLLLLAAPGCAPAGSLSGAAEGVEVRATNRHRGDVNVFAVRASQRTRLGTVPSGQSRTFRVANVQPGTATQLTLHVEVIGSTESWDSQVVSIVPGHRIMLALEPLISTSNLQVQEGP